MHPRLKIIWPFPAALASGFLLTLCFPNASVSWLIWVWMAPLLAGLWYAGPERKRGRYGFAVGYVSGAAFFLVSLSWLHEVTPPGAVLVALYLGLYFGLFGAFAATMGRPRDAKLAPLKAEPSGDGHALERSMQTIPSGVAGIFGSSLHAIGIAGLNAAAWAGLEWLRGIAFTGLGWNGLGVALHANLPMIQIADIVGVSGLSFMIMFCGCIGVTTIRRLTLEVGRQQVRPHLDFAVAVLLVILVFFYGMQQVWRKDLGETIPLRTVLIQPNLSMAEKWDPEKLPENYAMFDQMTSVFADTGEYDLIVWPETSLQLEFFHPYAQSFLNHLLEKGDYHLVLGAEEANPADGSFYNAIAVVQKSTRDVRFYRKTHLVPFGEYIPFRNSFAPFRWIAGKEIEADFTPGKSYEPVPLHASEVELIPAVCFEDTVGRVVRRFVRDGRPQVIVNVTNDGWFGETKAAEQHVANAKFRCVELKRPMIRCANTGVSCLIDAFGGIADESGFQRRIEDRETGSPFVRGSLADTVEVPVNPPRTVYARVGDLFSVTMLGVALAAALTRVVRARLRKASP